MMSVVNTWHKRLCHASKDKLSRIGLAKSNTINSSRQLCDSYAKAKLARTHFRISSIKTNFFYLIHYEIWGGYRVPSYTKANQFLTIVDDFSRVVWVFLIKHKSDGCRCLVNFHKMVMVKFGKHIERVRSDNGHEFTINHMLQFYNEQEILLEMTCSYTLQQNGVVDRNHRHLLQTARSISFEENLPKRFW